MKTNRTPRRGFAVMLTLIFIVLFLALLGVAWRRTASVLRIETARSIQAQRDTGSTVALARAMHLLETGFPPESPYLCEVTIASVSGPRSYTVAFTQTDKTQWTVRAEPTPSGESVEEMPDTFAPIP